MPTRGNKPHFPLFTVFRYLVTSVLILILTACGGSSGGNETNRLTQALSFPLETIMAQTDGEPITTQIATGGPSTGAITYTSGDTAVATVDAMTGAVTMVGAGETMITATRAIDARYEAAEASYKLIVATAQVTDTFVFPVEMMMAFAGDGPITIQVANSGQSAGTITYTSSNPAVATVHPTTGVVTIVKAGTVMITATRAMDTLYAAAEADYTLTVATARATDTLSFPTTTFMAFADANPITTQIATSGQSTLAPSYTSSNMAVATVHTTTGVVTILKAGETIITATRAMDARYQAAEASYTLTVTRAADALNFPSETIMAFADANPITTQIATSGQSALAPSYTSSNPVVAMVHTTTGVVTILKAGETIITATRAIDARYQAAEASYTLTVTRAMDTLRFPGETFLVAVGAEPITTQIATSGQSTLAPSYTSSNPAVATVHTTTGVVTILKAGETIITATRAIDARYQAAEASYTLTVARATDTLSFPSEALFASADHGLITTQIATGGQSTRAIAYTSDDIAIATVDPSTGIVTLVGTGTTTITATRAMDARYQATEASYKLTVVLTIDTLSFLTTKLRVPIDREPITTQVATGGLGTGAITYLSSNVAVATVDAMTGVVTIVGEGTVIITATQAMDASHKMAIAYYSLIVGTIHNTRTTTSGVGNGVCTTNTYTSGLVETICEYVGIEHDLGLDCDGDGFSHTRVLGRIVSRNSGGFKREFCVPTDRTYLDLLPPDPEELARRLQGAMSFSPTYIEDHGAIIETRESSGGFRPSTTNRYASGLVEVISVLQLSESQRRLDDNNDGDFRDFFRSRTVTRDDFLYSRHLWMLTGRGGTISEDLGETITNAPRRISLPEGIPDFLRFSGAIENIVIHVSFISVGQYYVKIDSNDPSVQLLVQKITDAPGANRLIEELRPDYFAGAPLIETTANTFYAIYAVKGGLYRATLDQYPNFYVRYDSVNVLARSLLKRTLDVTRNIVVSADIPEFLDYYDKVRVEYNPFQSLSTYSGIIFLNRIWSGSSQTLIHEVAHGYHANSLPSGFNNEEIKALYAMVSSDTSMQYGNERNTYWRTNSSEFFAEAMTTWLYLESGLVFRGFNPITQVDPTFYYANLKPWFDNHFNKED